MQAGETSPTMLEEGAVCQAIITQNPIIVLKVPVD